MFLGIYTLLYYAAAGALLPKEFFKRESGVRWRWLREKLGIFPKYDSAKNLVWIHAVSVGEVIAISRLVKELCKNYDVLISTITDTGQEVAAKRFKGLPVKTIYLPLDCPFAIKRTLKAFKPRVLLIAETELWPNLIVTSSKQIPVCLINGRLTEKSFKRYKKIKFFIKPVLNCFSFLAVQEEVYRKRFVELGVKEDRIFVTGNTKFDIEIKNIEFSWEKALIKPVILAGSTHEPEEKLIAEAFLRLEVPATLLVVPRHPQRFDQVESILRFIIKDYADVCFYRLSKAKFEDLKIKKYKKMIILIDQMGILGSLYRICDIAVIGGSFIPHGGQNPLEAIYWKKTVIFGPSMENFPFIKEFLDKKACIQTDSQELFEELKKLVQDEKLRKELGEAAYKIFKKKSGATERIFKILKKYKVI